MRLTIQPFAALDHLRDHRLREVDRRVHVHLEDDAAALQRDRQQRRVDRRSGVVHEDVDATVEQFERRRHDAGPVVGICEVGRDGLDTRAVLTTLRHRLVQAAGEVVVAVDRSGDDGDVRSLSRQSLGDGCADASACARHDGIASVESTHGHAPNSSSSTRRAACRANLGDSSSRTAGSRGSPKIRTIVRSTVQRERGEDFGAEETDHGGDLIERAEARTEGSRLPGSPAPNAAWT